MGTRPAILAHVDSSISGDCQTGSVVWFSWAIAFAGQLLDTRWGPKYKCPLLVTQLEVGGDFIDHRRPERSARAKVRIPLWKIAALAQRPSRQAESRCGEPEGFGTRMGKKRTSAKSAPSGASTPSVSSLRRKIDRLDRDLVKLINQRAQLALRIGKIKNSSGERVYAPAREEEVLARALELNKGPLAPDCVRGIFRELISGSRSLEKDLRVAFLGPSYSYSHLAALHRFGQSVEQVPVGSIAAVFEEVNRGHAHYGIVPLENSTDGRIADTLEMFTRLPVKICGEVQMWIHHCLLGKIPRADVTEVYSRPQALSQCRNWIAKHLPGARAVEVASTSTAAQLALDKPGAAAIASRQAGTNYGLDVLAENIEDNQANLTRFAVIGDESATRSGDDRTAVMFEIEHRPGALADAMGIFKRNRLNLTWIESFPIPRQQGAYMFFVELDGHEKDLRVRRALASLERKTLRFEVLGSFPQSTPVG